MEKVWRGISCHPPIKLKYVPEMSSIFEEELLKALDLEEDTSSIELL